MARAHLIPPLLVLPLLAVTATASRAEEPAPAPGPGPGDPAVFAATATDWLLSGQGLPRDYRMRLLRMDEAERLQAIVYLRRIGLLIDRPWTLDEVLRPAAPDPEPAP